MKTNGKPGPQVVFAGLKQTMGNALGSTNPGQIRQRCHRDEGLSVSYNPAKGDLIISCGLCAKHVITIRLPTMISTEA